MEREFKGNGCTIYIDGNNIRIKLILLKEENLTFNDVLSIGFKDASLMNGSVTMNTTKKRFELSFPKKQQSDFSELYNLLKKNCNVPEVISVATLDYKGGHPLLAKEGPTTLTTTNESLELSTAIVAPIVLKFDNILGIKVETQEQLSSRFTATRIALLGPFALAFKKKKKTSEKFLTIDFKDEHGIESTLIFSGPSVPVVHSKIYNEYSNYLSKKPKQKNTEASVSNASDPYEEIKKAKELLDMGIITQEEFDKKKKELLGL